MMDSHANATLAAVPEPSATPAVQTPWPEAWVGLLSLSAVAATVAMLPHDGSGLFVPALCLGVLAVAAGFDAATGRIPNPLTYTAVLLGLAINCVGVAMAHVAPRLAAHWLGAAGPAQSVLGLLLFGGIGVVGVLFAGMGGGDMKLLAAIGSLLGLSRAADVLICGAAVAVVYSLINLAINGRLNATCRVAACHLLNWFYLRRWTLSDDRESPVSRRTIPLALPLLAGMLLAQTSWVAQTIAWLTRPG